MTPRPTRAARLAAGWSSSQNCRPADHARKKYVGEDEAKDE
jgi:hypothetical protein